VAKFAGLKVSNYPNAGSGDFCYTGNDDDNQSDEDDKDHRCRIISGSAQSQRLQIQRMQQHQQHLQRQRQKQCQEIDWDSVAHPSRDMYGPVQAYQYYLRRHQMGGHHPAFAYLQVTRTASDEDLDDDLTGPIRQLTPFFPNPDDLKYPDPMTVRMSTHPKYHPFVSSTYKKDCRTWLYKNAVGRKARQLLAGSSSSHALSSSGQPQPRRQIQCFDNPPDSTTDKGANIMKAFAENDDEHQMLVDNDSEGVIGVPPMRDAGGAGAATADVHSTNPFNNFAFK